MGEILKAIKKGHVFSAIDELNTNGWDKRRNSTKYDLLYQNKDYPPKEVIRHAGIAATGEEPIAFGGGEEANGLLMRLGFTIVYKGTDIPIEKAPINNESNTDLLKKRWEKEVEEAESLIDFPFLSNSEKEALVKIRIGQGVFRNGLFLTGKTCKLCNVQDPQLLIASHIKPWKDCNTEERLDMDNGLLLCPNHDHLFDKGFISFETEGKIIISSRLSEVDRVFMNINSKMEIKNIDQYEHYMEWHRMHVFR